MVEQTYKLDAVFGSLSNPTRRDIVKRLSGRSMNVSELAMFFDISFAGVAKHLEVLERAGLVYKTRQGKEQIVTIDPKALAAANDYLGMYQRLWEQRLDKLDTYLGKTKK